MTEEPVGDGDGDRGDDGAVDDAPLEDLARAVRGRREDRESRAREGGDDPPEDDLFEPVDVGEVDDEAVWESLETETEPDDRVGLGAETERGADPNEHVVPKRDFCQRCPHLADPPETACTHQGTTIVEAVDTDRFRVRNCPVAEDDEAVSGGDR
jgi:hypothetical protein